MLEQFVCAAYRNVNEQQLHRAQKEQLTQHFHRSLKCLQQKEHVDGAVIVRYVETEIWCLFFLFLCDYFTKFPALVC